MCPTCDKREEVEALLTQEPSNPFMAVIIKNELPGWLMVADGTYPVLAREDLKIALSDPHFNPKSRRIVPSLHPCTAAIARMTSLNFISGNAACNFATLACRSMLITSAKGLFPSKV